MSIKTKPNAQIVVIPDFRLFELGFIENIDVIDYTFLDTNDFQIINFPVILQSDGTPWDIANLYILKKIETEYIGRINMKTYRGITDDLLDYLRFMEDNKLHYLSLPQHERLRVTYRYRAFLNSLFRKGKIKASTAKQRMNRVVNFYRSIIEWKLVDSKELVNQPFEDIEGTILTLDNKGFGRKLRTQSHNLAIKAAKKNHNPEYILDGGELRPLTLEEQTKILIALRNSRNREMQLIFYFALFTGARIQTCCTLRIKDLDRELDSEGYLRLRIGSGTEIDSKADKPITLKVPGWLVSDLKIYADSPKAMRHRKRSYYGDTKENYLFLTNRGQPYYTSKLEMDDWQHSMSNSKAVEGNKSISFRVHDGATVRVFLKGLITKIQTENPDFTSFRFHDLRATFGMNLLETLLANLGENQNSQAALIEVKERMGHSSIETTALYLDYHGHNNERIAVQDAFEKEVLQYVVSDSSELNQHIDQ